METGQISEYRIVKGKVVKAKTIHFIRPDTRRGNVIITKIEKH